MTQVESGQGMSQTTKIALGALAILAMAAGLWWYFSNMRTTDTAVDPVVPVVANSDTAGNAEVVTPPSEVAPMPSLEADSANLATTGEDSGVGIGTELGSDSVTTGGINPDVPLAGVPNKNPFSPLRLEPIEGSIGGGGSATNLAPPSDFGSSSSFAGDAPSFTSSAPVAVPSSTSSGSSSSDWDYGSSSDSSATMPSSPTASAGSAMSGGTSTPASSWNFDDDASNTSGATTDWTFDGNGAGGAANASEPVVAGLSPQSQKLPNSLGGTTSAASTSGGLIAAGPSSGSGVNTAENGLPSYVQQYGATSVAAPDDGTQLSRTLNTQDYHFTGSVIGPNSTAIFKSAQGFDVVEEGDILPGTNVVVRKIEKQRVVLALGTETVTLDLESLAKF